MIWFGLGERLGGKKDSQVRQRGMACITKKGESPAGIPPLAQFIAVHELPLGGVLHEVQQEFEAGLPVLEEAPHLQQIGLFGENHLGQIIGAEQDHVQEFASLKQVRNHMRGRAQPVIHFWFVDQFAKFLVFLDVPGIDDDPVG